MKVKKVEIFNKKEGVKLNAYTSNDYKIGSLFRTSLCVFEVIKKEGEFPLFNDEHMYTLKALKWRPDYNVGDFSDLEFELIEDPDEIKRINQEKLYC